MEKGICTLRETDCVGAWLLRIAGNVCTVQARALQRNGLAKEDEELGELMCKYGRASPDSYTTRSLVRDAVGRQGPDAREAAELFYFQGLRIVSTFLDDGFVANWGEGDKRFLVDGGRYVEEKVGVFRTTNGTGLGAGSFDVAIGDREFCCLRVLDPARA